MRWTLSESSVQVATPDSNLNKQLWADAISFFLYMYIYIYNYIYYIYIFFFFFIQSYYRYIMQLFHLWTHGQLNCARNMMRAHTLVDCPVRLMVKPFSGPYSTHMCNTHICTLHVFMSLCVWKKRSLHHMCFWISWRGRDLQGHLGADHVCVYITLGGAIFFDYMMARREGWKSRVSSADTSAHNIDCGPKTDEACAYWGEPWTQRGKLVIVIVMFKMAQHQPCSRFREWSTLPKAIVLAEGEALAPFMSMQDLPARDTLGTCR
jgi:hypothetical protein